MFAITSSSSTCGASGGSELLELRRVAVRDDDGGDLHREHVPVDVDRRLARCAPTRSVSRARAAQRATTAPGRRAPHARSRRSRRRGARTRPPRRRPRARRRPASRRPACRTPSPRRRAGRSPRSCVGKRSAAASWYEPDELVLRDEAAHVGTARGAARRASAASRSGPTTTSLPSGRLRGVCGEQRVLARLDRSRRGAGSRRASPPGRKPGSGASGVTTTFSGASVVELDEVVLRALRDREHGARATSRARDDDAEDRRLPRRPSASGRARTRDPAP